MDIAYLPKLNMDYLFASYIWFPLRSFTNIEKRQIMITTAFCLTNSIQNSYYNRVDVIKTRQTKLTKWKVHDSQCFFNLQLSNMYLVHIFRWWRFPWYIKIYFTFFFECYFSIQWFFKMCKIILKKKCIMSYHKTECISLVINQCAIHS